MKIANPDHLAYQALEAANTAKAAADTAQGTANMKARNYPQNELSNLSLEQLYALSQEIGNGVAVGALAWNSPILPTSSGDGAFLFIGNWTVYAFCMNGEMYILEKDPYRWEKRPQ